MNDIAISFLITPMYKQFYTSQLILKPIARYLVNEYERIFIKGVYK